VTSWAVILAVGIGSYALRALPMALAGRWSVSDRIERSASLAGTAALAALAAGGLRRGTGGPADAAAVCLVAGVALVVAVRGASSPRVLLAGGIVHAAIAGGAWLAT
jgi:branched-subunit amino acid transport protein